MTKAAVIGIIAIVVISVLAVVYVNSFTGAYSSSYGYGSSKLYGGGARKAAIKNPSVLGKNYNEALFTARMQDFMSSNKDKWECSFDRDGAESSGYPCVYDDSSNSYCCIKKLAPSGFT